MKWIISLHKRNKYFYISLLGDKTFCTYGFFFIYIFKKDNIRIYNHCVAFIIKKYIIQNSIVLKLTVKNMKGTELINDVIIKNN